MNLFEHDRNDAGRLVRGCESRGARPQFGQLAPHDVAKPCLFALVAREGFAQAPDLRIELMRALILFRPPGQLSQQPNGTLEFRRRACCVGGLLGAARRRVTQNDQPRANLPSNRQQEHPSPAWTPIPVTAAAAGQRTRQVRADAVFAAHPVRAHPARAAATRRSQRPGPPAQSDGRRSDVSADKSGECHDESQRIIERVPGAPMPPRRHSGIRPLYSLGMSHGCLSSSAAIGDGGTSFDALRACATVSGHTNGSST